MNGSEYQNLAKRTAVYPEGVAIYYLTLGLTGEAGEIANKVKKIIRDNDSKITDEMSEDLKKELGDVMWYIAMLCNELNISLDDVMKYNIDKLASRMERGKLQGQGDER